MLLGIFEKCNLLIINDVINLHFRTHAHKKNTYYFLDFKEK